MKKNLMIMGTTIAMKIAIAQTTTNLIPNPGFENGNPTVGSLYLFSNVVPEGGNLTKVPNWRSACDGEQGSPDLFDVNSTDANYDIPTNKWASNVPVRVSGTKRYMGMSSLEPVQCETGGTIEANKKYNLTFYYTPSQRVGLNNPPTYITSGGPAIEVLLRSSTGSCSVQKLIYTSTNATSNNGTWLYNATNFTLTPSEAANNFDRIEFRIKNGTGGLQVFMDDFSLTRDLSTACFTINNVMGSALESSYYGPQTVFKVCNDANISIDGTCSKNEDRYWVGVEKFNLSTWTTSEVVKQGQWISPFSQAGYFNLRNFVGPSYVFDNNAVYMVSFNVGLDWDSNPSHTIKFFRTINCKTTEVNSTDELVSKISIYPNPSKGIFNLEFSGTDVKSFEVFDAVGKLILNKEVKQSDISTLLDLTSYQEGLYVIRINTNNGIIAKKIIKE